MNRHFAQLLRYRSGEYYHWQRMNMIFVPTAISHSKRTQLLRHGLLICSMLLLMPGAPAQTQTPSVSADELVRRTVVNELAAADDGGHYQYRFEEQTAHGSEIRDVLESRGWSVDRLILKNGRPLPF